MTRARATNPYREFEIHSGRRLSRLGIRPARCRPQSIICESWVRAAMRSRSSDPTRSYGEERVLSLFPFLHPATSTVWG